MIRSQTYSTTYLRTFVGMSRALLLCFVLVLFSFSLPGQTTLYNQPFSGTLAAGGWVNTNLAAPWGNGSSFGISNVWQVNDLESGLPANTCGAGGMGDQSLYMGATAFASGAAYLSDANTNRRISSPNIITTGYSNVTIGFDFIGNGEGTVDKAYLVYSINGGTSWVSATGAPTSVSPAFGAGGDLGNLKSQICPLGQGLWTHVSWLMPASCGNIINLRIGFVWQSNNNSLGSDPSFAVDDVTITATIVPTPVELLDFSAIYNGSDAVSLKWVTASELNNDYFSIERSEDAVSFTTLLHEPGAGNSSHLNTYLNIDDHPLPGVSYYRLKQTDYNGDFEYSDIKAVKIEPNNVEIINAYNSFSDGSLVVTVFCPGDTFLSLDLYNLQGKKVISLIENSSDKIKKIQIPAGNLAKGIYLIKVVAAGQQVTRKVNL